MESKYALQSKKQQKTNGSNGKGTPFPAKRKIRSPINAPDVPDAKVPRNGNNPDGKVPRNGNNLDAKVSRNGNTPDTKLQRNGNNTDAKVPRNGNNPDAKVPRNGNTPDAKVPSNGNTPDAKVPRNGNTPEAKKPRHGNFLEAKVPRNGNTPDVKVPGNGNAPDAKVPRNGNTPEVKKPRNGSSPEVKKPRNGSSPEAKKRNGSSPESKKSRNGSSSDAKKPRNGTSPEAKKPRNGSSPEPKKPRNGNSSEAKTPRNGKNTDSNGKTTPSPANQPTPNNNSQARLEEQRKALPAYHCQQRLVQEARKANSLVIMGETGSGKTTQIPQFLYAAGFTRQGSVIGVTQPRRVAAITVAKRVSLEMGCRLGDIVGYTVRFEDCTSPQTRIRFLTDGMLLREALGDRLLRNYSVLMLDEAHERTVNTDVLFGIVKEAQKQRRMRGLAALKLIITSATMDIDHFADYFGVRGMYLEGRTHPVRVLHTKEPQSDYLHAALVTIFDIHRKEPTSHDILVFLTGQEEIEAMAQQIRQIAKANTDTLSGVRVFSLYAQLPQNKQLQCFLPAPTGMRKIVLATNIAETSITIPGIRCVIDCGFVKRRIYTPSSGLDVLRVVRTSQAQAWQRCGRAGRDAPGDCYRTYTQTEMATFENMPKPEILRSNLSSTALQLLALGIDCKTFDFLDAPTPDALESAYRKLETLGAIHSAATQRELTALGRQMAQFPLDPQYSKVLLCASEFGCMEEMLSLVAVLSGETLFVSTVDKRELAALAHAKFNSKQGDHLTLLNVYKAFQKTDKLKLWCHDNFLNTRNLCYARDVRKQLLEIVERLGLEVNTCGTNYDAVRKCLLAGLHGHIAELQRDKFYLTLAGRQRAKIHPSSVFHGKYRPEYVLYTEMVLTERNYLRQVTEIDPEWIAEVVPNYPHLSRIRHKS